MPRREISHPTNSRLSDGDLEKLWIALDAG
jgi:hypothetical protein